VEKDYKKAFEYFSKAAEQSWVDGQLYLGENLVLHQENGLSFFDRYR
jgi:TPR repeat protein